MHRTFWGILLGLLIGAGATWLVMHSKGAAVGPSKSEGAPAATAEVKKENPLHIPAEKRVAAGITLVSPTAETSVPDLPAFARALDPSPLIGLIADVAATQAAFDVSSKELQRVRKLHDFNGNASAQALDAADAAAARDQAALSAASFRLTTLWGKAFTDLAAHGGLQDALEKGATLVRIDMVGNEPLPANLKTVAVSSLGNSSDTFAAEVVGPAPSVDPQIQGVALLALVRGHVFPAGAALSAKVPGPGAAKAALSVPRSAIVYHQGSAWVYVLGEEETFERKLVTIASTTGNQVALASGIAPEDQVVATGAEQVLAAELQAGQSGGDD